jgi:hypothetical protein
MDTTVSFLSLRGTVSVIFYLAQCWPWVCHIESLLCWGVFLLSIVSSVFLSWKCIAFYQRLFSESIERILWFLSLLLFMYCSRCLYLRMLNHPCIPGNKPSCSWCMIFFTCCWILYYIFIGFQNECNAGFM